MTGLLLHAHGIGCCRTKPTVPQRVGRGDTFLRGTVLVSSSKHDSGNCRHPCHAVAGTGRRSNALSMDWDLEILFSPKTFRGREWGPREARTHRPFRLTNGKRSGSRGLRVKKAHPCGITPLIPAATVLTRVYFPRSMLTGFKGRRQKSVSPAMVNQSNPTRSTKTPTVLSVRIVRPSLLGETFRATLERCARARKGRAVSEGHSTNSTLEERARRQGATGPCCDPETGKASRSGWCPDSGSGQGWCRRSGWFRAGQAVQAE